MRIDVWADLVCPFCHVGRRRLDLALEQFEHGDQFDVIWHSFQLDRNAPAVSDRPVIDQVADKYGVSREQMVATHEHMATEAAEVGLDFQWEQLQGVEGLGVRMSHSTCASCFSSGAFADA